jgi:cell shape-determining protein MreC
LEGLTPKKRGRKPAETNPLEKENAELKRALAKAELRAKRAEGLVELQKKVSELFGIQLPKEDETP